MEDNKNPKGAAPKAPPCCLPFGKDFLCFGLISGAHLRLFHLLFFGTVHLPWFSQNLCLRRLEGVVVVVNTHELGLPER